MKITNSARVIFFVLAILNSLSCNPTQVSKEKLISYIEHNKVLNQTREINGIKVQIKYCPYQLLVLQELESKGSSDSVHAAFLENKYNKQYYFRLSYSKAGKEVIRQMGSFQQYSDMLQVFSFELGKYISASTQTGSELPLLDYAFEQQYGLSNSNSVMLAFKKSDFDSSDDISVNVSEFGLGIGTTQFVFKKSELEKISKLNYSATL